VRSLHAARIAAIGPETARALLRRHLKPDLVPAEYRAEDLLDALAAGEVITTGTLTAALPIRAGETWTSEISGVGVAPLTITLTG